MDASFKQCKEFSQEIMLSLIEYTQYKQLMDKDIPFIKEMQKEQEIRNFPINSSSSPTAPLTRKNKNKK